MRALVVSNMLPDARHPERGRFVRDQVDALRRLPGVEVELYEFPPGGAALIEAARWLHRHHGGRGRHAAHLDVVHAHFGLTAWPALAARARVRGLTVHGTDVRHPRTRLATRAVLPLMDLVAAPTAELAYELPGARRDARAGAAVRRGHGALPPDPARERPRRARPGPARPPACCSPPIPRAPASATTARLALARALSSAHAHPPAGALA